MQDLTIVRLIEPSEAALAILNEYYDAINVVQRDNPAALNRIFDSSQSGMWLACLGTEPVGCVVLRQLANMPGTGECKRLYVKPVARGKGIADKLMDALEQFACDAGLDWIYLDSYDDLKSAIALYERRGYSRCDPYNDNSQATLFMRKRLG